MNPLFIICIGLVFTLFVSNTIIVLALCRAFKENDLQYIEAEKERLAYRAMSEEEEKAFKQADAAMVEDANKVFAELRAFMTDEEDYNVEEQ